MTNNRFWYLVQKLDWHNSDYDCGRLGMLLVNLIDNIEEIEEMREMAREKRHELDKQLFDYGQKNPKQHYWGGDDSFWDFTAHIVGMGKEFFNRVKASSEVINELGDNFVENFEYIFTNAKNFAATKEGQQILNKKKRKEKLERLV